MIQTIKTGLEQRLTPDAKDQLRDVAYHFNGLFKSVFSVGKGVKAEKPFPMKSAEQIRRVQKTYNKLKSADAKRALTISFMQEVTADLRYRMLLDTPNIKSLFGGEDIYYYALGAATFAAGMIDEANAVFEEELRVRPTALAYLCRARSLSQGQANDKAAVDVLTRGIKEFPHDFELILSKAAAQHRLNQSDAANKTLEQGKKDLPTQVRGSDPNIVNLEAELEHALKTKTTSRPKGQAKDGYNDASIRTYWNLLWYYMASLGKFQHGWSALNYRYQELIGGMIDMAPEIESVINFGVFCAMPDYYLAKKFPNVSFYGVDRDLITNDLNENAFPAPNLKFLADNITDCLPQLASKSRPSLLFHARTTTLCYPEFVRQFYGQCAKVGVRYIALWENNSLSRSTLRYHSFDDLERPVPYCQQMFIHNYKSLLEQAGYEIILTEHRTSNHDLLDSTRFLGDGHVYVVGKLRA